MLTFQDLYTKYGRLTKDTSTTAVADGKKRINDSQKSICQSANFTFLDDEMYATSVASQAAYRLPSNYMPNSISTVYVLQGGIKYFPKEIHSTTEFESIAIDTSTSSYPEYYCIYNDYINFYPLPSDTSWTIYAKFRQMPREMSADDYSTGTITATLNSAAIVGAATTFTSAMINRWIKLPDGIWYQIRTYTNATNISLYKTYEGATTAGASYTIGDCPIIPDGYQDIILYKPLEDYFMMTGEESRSTFYKNLYDMGIRDLKSRYLTRSSNSVFRASENQVINPNDYPVNLS